MLRPDLSRFPRLVMALLADCLLLAACVSVPTPSPLAPPTLTVTPAQAPVLQCTPPLCWEDEAYFCPGKCPGGCGTTCATRTPAPNASPTPTFPPLSDVCALPTPDPSSTLPGMSLCASALQIHTGGVIQLAAELHGLNRLDFISIVGQDLDGSGNFYARARVGDHFPALNNYKAHVTLAHVQTHNDQIFVILQANSPGMVKVDFRVIPTVPDVQASITLTIVPYQ